MFIYEVKEKYTYRDIIKIIFKSFKKNSCIKIYVIGIFVQIFRMCVKHISNLSRDICIILINSRNIFEYFIESHINKCNGKTLIFIHFDVI